MVCNTSISTISDTQKMKVLIRISIYLNGLFPDQIECTCTYFYIFGFVLESTTGRAVFSSDIVFIRLELLDYILL